MSRSGWDPLPNVRDWLRPPQMSKGGQENPPGSPRLVGSLSQRSGSDQEAFPDVREWSGGPNGCPRLVGGPP